MTVVIADSSPLNYLTLIGSVDVPRELYGSVVVPQQVISELIDPAAPRDAILAPVPSVESSVVARGRERAIAVTRRLKPALYNPGAR